MSDSIKSYHCKSFLIKNEEDIKKIKDFEELRTYISKINNAVIFVINENKKYVDSNRKFHDLFIDSNKKKNNEEQIIHALLQYIPPFFFHKSFNKQNEYLSGLSIMLKTKNNNEQEFSISAYLKEIQKNKYWIFEFFPINNGNSGHLSNEKFDFRRILYQAADSLLLLKNGQIIYASPNCIDLFGISAERIIENSTLLKNLFVPDDLNMENILKGEIPASLIKIKHFSSKIFLPDNEVKWLLVRIAFPDDENDEKSYSIGLIFNDISSQKKFEKSLIKSLQQQRAILNNIPHLIWFKDEKGKYVSVNKAFLNHYGFKEEDIINRTDHEINSKDFPKQNKKEDHVIISSKKSIQKEEFSKSSEGNTWMETFKTPVIDKDGSVYGITGISMDITERKKMEVLAKESEARFQSLLQNSSDAITILDKKGNIIFENAENGKISGFSYEELWGKSVFTLVHPEDREKFKDVFEEVIKSPDSARNIEFRSLHSNRKWVYVESILSNQITNPSIRGIVVNSRDISERKLAELKERVYHKNLVFLSNSALDLLDISSRDEMYQYIGQRLHDFLSESIVLVSGYHEIKKCFIVQKIAGLNDQEITKLEKILDQKITGMRIPVIEKFNQFLSSGKLVQLSNDFDLTRLEIIPETKITQIFNTFQINKGYTIRMSRHNKKLGIIVIFMRNKNIIKNKHIIETFVNQISVALQRSQLEYELIMAKEKAEESDKLKSAFLANMSHEIRTPINGILGFIELIESEDISENERKKYTEIIYNNSKILVNLIDDIIDISKIEAGQIKIEKKNISLNILSNQVYTSFMSHKLLKEKAEVKLKLKKGLNNENCNIRTDPIRLRQILNNLIGNAIKFTDKGYIEFGYQLIEEGKKKKILFFVKDTGIGFPPTKKEVIFDRFTQVDHSASRKYGGSGLGLAISKGLSELLGGNMWVESVEDHGSNFYFTLPYEKVSSVDVTPMKPIKQKLDFNWQDKVLLIAEDDKFSYKFLEGFLKKTKATILHAPDGSEAVKMCLENKDINLVLMDIQMPEMNGYDATMKIKEFRQDLPVIAQTANALEEEKKKCYAAGCDDYLTKPINVKEMFSLIEKYLKKNI